MRLAAPVPSGLPRVTVLLRNGRRKPITFLANLFEHCVEELKEVVVLEPDHAQPVTLQPLRS